MVSELAVKFGRDFKAQLATVVLFRIVAGSETVMNNSWKQIVDRGQKQAEAGIFSAFTSYISSYAADDPPEPSDEELESTLCTVDCVNACSMGDVFANVVHKCEVRNRFAYFTQCTKGSYGATVRSFTHFWVILRNLAGTSESAKTVFEILEGVAVGSPPTVMADNYEPAVKLLNDFASAGSVGATVEQKKDKRPKRGQPKKAPEKQPEVDAAVARGEEAVPESLKNILLVMSSSGYLVPPSQDPEHEKLWVETWKRIDRFLPDLKKDLDLEAPKEAEKPLVPLSPSATEAKPEDVVASVS
ncbi:hypothetical protein M7I_3912 [Glarea lozoyensis 74030]|uniref:GBF1-like tetratricopeptide repeats domain-containing protein n=1 Tax=Glarea lozoyensis (strain ATCC 74030 / MF5533) TaxID=1104152 RepID=H0EMR8_GLAL7|nr:hypothetical protein M7I_3912 [Glarea lozoyensis 74030]